MSPRFDHDQWQRLDAELASGDERASEGRSASRSLDRGLGALRIRPREDPGGRRSLTGVEFRRQRSG